MTAHPAYQILLDSFKRVDRIDHAVVILNWDQLVMMPEAGVQARAEALAELSVMRHEILSSEKIKEAIDHCQSDLSEFSDGEQRSLYEMSLVYEDISCLPSDLVKAKVMAGSRCEHGWRTQRSDNDWDGFLGNFKEVVALSREEARIRQSARDAASPYDALLDLHCRGDSSALIDKVFGELKAALPTMIDQAIEQQGRRSTHGATLTGHFPVQEQTNLSHALMSSLGFDFSAGRLDVSAHPFSTGVRGDQRITTRYDESSFLDALLATAHETGHASYEAGLPAEWAGLPVGESRNMCTHESISLFFEKQLTLSKPFLAHLHGLIGQHLKDAKDLSLDALTAHARTVTKSFIRVEADELTYPLHVALRYDIERDLMNGVMEPEDIPDAWDAAMQAGLGLSTKDNYTNGCLQDTHWSDGTFGYFPSYTLGAVNSAQLFKAMTKDHTDWEAQLAAGETGFAREWLSNNIWKHGSHRSSQELMKAATGKGSDAGSLIAHLDERYLAG